MEYPTIDILLATYNGATYLPDQLNSLLDQTYPCFRVLISDDGSIDGTLKIIDDYVSKHPGKVFKIHNPNPSRGAMKNFEHLMTVSLAEGRAKWMAFADQDDVWRADKLTLCASEMQRMEASGFELSPCLVHTDLYVTDASGSQIHASFAAYEGIRPLLATPESMLSVNVVTGCTMMVNRSLLQLALPIPDEAVIHDWWCAVVSGVGRRTFIPQATVGYRQHLTNHIGARNRSLWGRLKRLANLASVLKRVLDLGVLTLNQAFALNDRLNERGIHTSFVSEYIEWRQCSKWEQLRSYRKYYLGPEIDRLSRWWFWGRPNTSKRG